MPWNSTSPNGALSVAANRPYQQENTTYIETTMGNSVVGTNTVTTRDHFWNVGSNENGRHRFIQSPAFTVGGLPTNPVIGTGMDSVLFSKLLTVTESTAQQDVQPFFRNVTGIMQLLGIRACAVFNGSGTMVYQHNVSSVSRTATGRYTVNFSTALPSNAYLVLGGAIRNDSSASAELLFEIQGATTLTNVKSTALVKVMTNSDGGTAHDPLQAWVVCFGG